MFCIMCDKQATVTASGNSYCDKHFKESPYFAEIQAKRRIYAEKQKAKKQ